MRAGPLVTLRVLTPRASTRVARGYVTRRSRSQVDSTAVQRSPVTRGGRNTPRHFRRGPGARRAGGPGDRAGSSAAVGGISPSGSGNRSRQRNRGRTSSATTVSNPKSRRFDIRNRAGILLPQLPPSSRGPGLRVLSPATGVRIPLGVPFGSEPKKESSAVVSATAELFCSPRHGVIGGPPLNERHASHPRTCAKRERAC